jgi:hypothetical protein
LKGFRERLHFLTLFPDDPEHPRPRFGSCCTGTELEDEYEWELRTTRAHSVEISRKAKEFGKVSQDKPFQAVVTVTREQEIMGLTDDVQTSIHKDNISRSKFV